MTGIFDDYGVRFEYPGEWEVEVTGDGERTVVALQAPDGLTLCLVTLAEDRPAPSDLATEALEAMREEYPALDAVAADETIDGHRAVGHDLEFFSLDIASGCEIRCFRTPRRTVLIFGQWTEAGDEAAPAQLRSLRHSLEETDA